jgi:flavin-dependent dehydrogenase
MPADADIAILGGGPAGCAAALALRRLGHDRVVVIEAGAYDRERIGESVPPDTGTLLESLGIRAEFLAESHDPCHGSRSAWGAPALGYNDFLFNPNGHGWHLDRRRFDRFLAERAEASGVQLRRGTEFRAAERDPTGFRLRLAGAEGEETAIRARFVIDATGKRSHFAVHQGAKRLLLDQLTAIAGFFDLRGSEYQNRLTLLEAAETGWWYAARLPGERLVVMIATDPDIVRARNLTDAEAWRAALRETQHVAAAVAASPLIGDAVRAWAAPSFRLDFPCGPAWLAIGDAAASYDPISAQGIHKALADGLAAAETAAAYLKGNAAALDAHAARIAAGFEDFRRNRKYFYDLEKRWQQSPFWLRRHGRGGKIPNAEAPGAMHAEPARA